ncbi:hypothetical protein DICPUDRAFT_76527 [Dictyostelium purpureum]|uniref:Uncharacterized protein n=1 Tax=Dictyostelium purpureum TaxID=5786 RepID=F0ZDW2_DICPU|nr:uncharacterized protein DICPUDRAFT_76527 [Dictyostelium purpureum]EGC37870.1 hypothetical protein DICPUDRAFT_76527 [Dictyostelium purpureum]|eukprot:XP_003285620.1 hypothetical protein DICPUDRAFT_76527 [Dictyostelium purpureum]
MKNKILSSTATFFNLAALVLIISSFFLPWYHIEVYGRLLDNYKYYSTLVNFKLNSYTCDYLNDNSEKESINKLYGNGDGSECYPILPPTASLFGLGIVFIVIQVFLAVSVLSTFLGIVLQVVLFLSSRYRNIWVKIIIFGLSLVTITFLVLALVSSSKIHTGLQSYNSDDTQGTHSDEVTADLCDDMWCGSFKGWSNFGSPYLINYYSGWGPKSGFIVAIIGGGFTIISCFISFFIFSDNEILHNSIQEKEYTKI